MPRPSTQPVHPRELILNALRKSKAPMSAYDLLGTLATHGIKGPPVVYRALEHLMQQGHVHKIQAIGAYVACNCASDHSHALSVLTVCYGCKTVKELHDHTVIHHLEELRGLGVPLREHAVIELPVLCSDCAANS
jgi:Fur family transcriptional regulator, zinc uptake regulator